MFPKLTDAALTAALILTLALIALATSAINTTVAQAYVLGAGDGAQYPAAPSAALGAKTYRVVIDPAQPLESYTPRILAHRAVGQEPQLVIGGTGTQNHASSRGVVRAAVAAAKRWPSAYSISVINEPNESGMGVCEYARTYVQAYRSLKAVGVKRVLFGEWSPTNAVGWQRATLTRCKHSSKLLRNKVARVAWHGYGPAIDLGDDLEAVTKAATGHTPMLYVTEAGFVLRSATAARAASAGDTGGVRYWRHALNVARRGLAQIVAWDIHSPQTGAWDSGLIDGNGRPRPAFGFIASQQ